MMKKSIFILLILVALVSCKKKGCTDSKASNFDTEAVEDDNSCTYNADVSFWFNSTVSFFLDAYDVTDLSVYINDSLVGNMDPTDSKTEPDCGGDAFTFVYPLNDFPYREVAYRVDDQTGNDQFSGIITVYGGECTSKELKW